MTNRQPIVHTFPSTKWEFRPCKIAGPPQGRRSTRSEAEGSYRVARRDERKPLNVEVKYLGGPEAVWLLKCRGHEWKVSGAQALHDALLGINGAFWKKAAPA